MVVSCVHSTTGTSKLPRLAASLLSEGLSADCEISAYAYFEFTENISVALMVTLGFDLIIIRFICIHTHF
jgi:hypothetical protein